MAYTEIDREIVEDLLHWNGPDIQITPDQINIIAHTAAVDEELYSKLTAYLRRARQEYRDEMTRDAAL